MTPICLAKPQDVAPHRYVLHIKQFRCRNCNTLSTHSELYAHNKLRARMALGKYVEHLVPITEANGLQWQVPIATSKFPVREVPICHECFDTISLSHLPIPESTHEIVGLMKEVEGKKGRPVGGGTKHSAPPKLSDLDIP